MTHNTEWDLAALIERGGVHYDVPGANRNEFLSTLTGLLPAGPDPEHLYREILEREALVSTGVGRGIALPHPRSPDNENGGPFVSLAFPGQPLDWNTQDGSRVHTVFLIVSSSAKQHLNVLSKINFLCQQEKFYSLIYSRASPESIITAIREAETTWKRKE